MFVEHDAVEAHLLRVHLLVEVRVVEVGAFLGVVEAVGNAKNPRFLMISSSGT